MINAGIVGGTGYTGVELLRLLSGHPEVELVTITSRGASGTAVTDLYPSMRGALSLRFDDPATAPLTECDVVFCAAPNGVAMSHAGTLLEAGVRMIDLSADFRLRDPELWRKWYGKEHTCPDLLDEAVYGLCEVNREAIREAQLLANPGCYPTAVQLGLLPLLEGGLVDPGSLIADVKSGISGAGRKEALATQFSEVSDSFKAYSVAGHRHQPEIQQELELVCGRAIGLTFVPHLAPMVRGIHATLYARLTRGRIDLQEVFENRYRDEPFVDVMPAGSHPETRSVRGANICRLAVHRPQNGDVVVVLAVEDNLVKGAAGQAVQNMNIMFGLPETMGLESLAIVP